MKDVVMSKTCWYCGARIGEVNKCPHCGSKQWMHHLTDEQKHEAACAVAKLIEEKGGKLWKRKDGK